MQDIVARVKTQTTLSAGYRFLELEAPVIAAAATPGQFVHVRVTGLDQAALRRPFSIYRAADGILAILYKTVGRGTEQLARLQPGETVSVMGPLGHGFPCDAPGRPPVLVAGGYGVAPLAFLASRLPAAGTIMIGGRTAADILCVEDFASRGWDVRLATEDGSRGTRGLATALLDAWLAANGSAAPTFYACGPDGLLRAVAERADRAGRPAWVSLDKHLMCGVGACLACVQRVRRPDGATVLARSCHDGPVFAADTVVWENER